MAVSLLLYLDKARRSAANMYSSTAEVASTPPLLVVEATHCKAFRYSLLIAPTLEINLPHPYLHQLQLDPRQFWYLR